MWKQIVFVAALTAAVSPSFAQEETGQQPGADAQHQMPNPKHPEHAALETLAGSWQSTVKMAAMPGVPGMEKPSELTATERAELICDGLWLRCTIHGTYMGQPYHGVWLAGYDPHEKQYVGVYTDNHENAPAEMTGTYDAESKTWSWSGKCPQGATRSEVVWKDADTMIETCYLTPEGGEEMQTMQITRQRSGSAATVPAMAARGEAELPAEVRELHKGVGEWRAVVSMKVDRSQPETEEPATETVMPICDGKYTWSDFHGRMMGMPFEGHALCGYDSNAGEYVSYWIDSMSPTWSRTTGTFDAENQAITMTGRCVDCYGKPMTMTEVMTWKGDDTRLLHMEFDSEQGTHRMDIRYERVSKR